MHPRPGDHWLLSAEPQPEHRAEVFRLPQVAHRCGSEGAHTRDLSDGEGCDLVCVLINQGREPCCVDEDSAASRAASPRRAKVMDQ